MIVDGTLAAQLRKLADLLEAEGRPRLLLIVPVAKAELEALDPLALARVEAMALEAAYHAITVELDRG
jgi:hypothetical protein